MDKIIPICKDPGITSFDIIREIKGFYKGIKIGHCGTLDPFAEGLLLVCTGKKTKEIDQLVNTKKEYIAKIYFGSETDTLDSTGSIIKENNFKNIDREYLINILESFKGTNKQIPPYFSALKLNGVRLYKFARKDIFIKKRPRDVLLYDIEMLKIDKNILDVRLICGKGFYVRAFARDLAYKLNTFGHLLSLKRTAIGSYSIENAINVRDLSYD
tara:strand:- start:5581 stop:6222 length:642 start_codon:yes stop_codon:yes gene_type:complete